MENYVQYFIFDSIYYFHKKVISSSLSQKCPPQEKNIQEVMEHFYYIFNDFILKKYDAHQLNLVIFYFEFQFKK